MRRWRRRSKRCGSSETNLDQAIAEMQQEGLRISPGLLYQERRHLDDEIAGVNRALQRCRRDGRLILRLGTTIAGVEVTQAIQYWNTPPGAGSGFAANNSIPLVSERETVLRVYTGTRSLLGLPKPGPVSGRVTVSGYSAVLGYGSTLTLQPVGGPIAAKPLGLVERSSAGDSLNFVIPAAICQGSINCEVEVFDTNRPADVVPWSLNLSFQLVPRLRVHGVLVHYTGLDYNDNPVDTQPTGLDLAVTCDYVFRTYPIPAIDYTGCTVLPWSAKVAVGQNFQDLFAAVAALQAMSGTGDIYAGLLPPAAGCGGICGLGGNGSALFFAGNGADAAHEIGHALGRLHTQCARTAPGADPNYPTYDGFPQGSIGEVGFDVYGPGRPPFDPQKIYDFMSYCTPGFFPPPWVSPYTYLGLLNAISTTATAATASAANEPESVWASPAVEFAHLFLRVYRAEVEQRVEVINAFSVTGAPPPLPDAQPSRCTVELLDADGRLVDAYRCQGLDPRHDKDDFYEGIAVAFPVLSDVRSLRIVEAGQIISSMAFAAHAPRVTVTAVERVGDHDDRLRVRWRGEAPRDAEPALRFQLRYSHDGGGSWRGIAAGLNRDQDQYVLALSFLPGGADCRVEVIASAGLRTATAISEPFEVPRKPRQAHIVLPATGEEFAEGTVVPLAGGGFSPDFGTAPSNETVWLSSSLGIVGTGQRVSLHGLPVGRHQITLRVPDGLGGEASASTEVSVVRAPCP